MTESGHPGNACLQQTRIALFHASGWIVFAETIVKSKVKVLRLWKSMQRAALTLDRQLEAIYHQEIGVTCEAHPGGANWD